MSKDITYEAFKSSIEKDFESYLQEENKELNKTIFNLKNTVEYWKDKFDKLIESTSWSNIWIVFDKIALSLELG